MIRVYETPANARYYPEQMPHQSNGIANAALATAIPAGVISLANFAKEWLSNKGGSATGENVSKVCSMLAPAIAAVSGRVIAPDTVLTEKEAEIARLKAEKYTDIQVAELYKANTQAMKDQFEYTLGIEKRQATTEAEVKCLKQELTTYEISQREKEALKDQIVDGKIEKTVGMINCLAEKVNDGFTMTNQGFATVNARIDNITKVVVPSSAVCKVKECCNNGCEQ